MKLLSDTESLNHNMVSHELRLARVLAGNNENDRERALKHLSKWFQHRSKINPFCEVELMRIWKALYFTMWMADKPLIQENCAENISKLIHCFNIDTGLMFYKCGMHILVNEWFGIDQWRMDKFLMLVRRFLRQTFIILKDADWMCDRLQEFGLILEETVLRRSAENPVGLFMHFTEIFLEELSKIVDEKLSVEHVQELIIPFVRVLSYHDDSRHLKCVVKFIFEYLLKQSDVGIEYEAKYAAWRTLGFPGTIDQMERVECIQDGQDDNDDQEKVLDPRAGGVNVDLSQIPFDTLGIAQLVAKHKFLSGVSGKNRRILNRISKIFKRQGRGDYPLGTKQVLKPMKKDHSVNIQLAAEKYMQFNDALKLNSRRNRKRKSSKCEPEQSNNKAKSLTLKKTVKMKSKQKPLKGKNVINKSLSIKLKDLKRVKIDTNLNSSQNIQQHEENVRKSPAIPYDANRQPSRPLLKKPSYNSPINPFYVARKRT